VARKPKPPDEQPVMVIGAEIRLYPWEPELIKYFQQFKPGQYATAIKRAVRAALSGGELALGGLSRPSPGSAAADEEVADFDEFVG